MAYTCHPTICALFAAVLLFYQVTAIASGQLGIQINDEVARRANRRVIYGSIAQIDGLSQWTDEQIVDLAFVAHNDMRNAHQAIDFPTTYPGLSRKVPGVTTTLVIDNTAYISSSMGGGPFLYIPNGNTQGSRFTNPDPAHPCPAVQDALARCQARSVNLSGHRTGASCGEPMAALAFCATHNQQPLTNAKIVTITGKASYKILAPCGNPAGQLEYDGEWGCHDFTTEIALNMHIIPEGTGRTATNVPADQITITYATYP